MQNPLLESHELLCLYLKSFYGLKACSEPTRAPAPGARIRKAVTKARSGHRRRGRLAF
jgi:hypothetical protein